jgi:predicted RNA-binding protein
MIVLPRLYRVVRRPCYAWQNWRTILGRNTSWSHGLSYHNDFVATVPWMRESTNVIVGGASSGKSGIWKPQIDQSIAIREMKYGKATGIVFDGVGRDGRLLKEPGAEGYIFEKEGMFRAGHANVISMTPWFLRREAYKDDILFSIPWTVLDYEEWDFLFSQMGDAKSWLFQLKNVLMRRKHLIVSLEWLLEEFEKKAAQKTYKSAVIPNLLGELAVQAIVRGLSSIIEQGFLTEPNDPRNYSVTDLMSKGWIPVVNFHHNSDAATKLYTAVLARQVYDHYDELAKWYEERGVTHWTGPFFVFEEFSSIVSKQKLGDPPTPAEKRVEDIIKKGRKNRFELWIVLQDMKDVPGEIRRSLASHRIYVRNPTADDLREIESKVTRVDVNAGEIIRSLQSAPEESGAREWVLFDNGMPITFMGVGAMSKLHVR